MNYSVQTVNGFNLQGNIASCLHTVIMDAVNNAIEALLYLLALHKPVLLGNPESILVHPLFNKNIKSASFLFICFGAIDPINVLKYLPGGSQQIFMMMGRNGQSRNRWSISRTPRNYLDYILSIVSHVGVD